MRRLIMWNLQSLDGYFEGASPWDLGFHMTAWGEELEQFSLAQGAEVGGLVFGRATYLGMAEYWGKETGPIADFMNGVPKFVCSRTLEVATWANSRLLRGDAAAMVSALKQEEGRDLFVFGSARLSGALRAAGLFDEYRICLAPIVLGSGQPLFPPRPTSERLSLIEARPLRTGALILRYGPASAEESGS